MSSAVAGRSNSYLDCCQVYAFGGLYRFPSGKYVLDVKTDRIGKVCPGGLECIPAGVASLKFGAIGEIAVFVFFNHGGEMVCFHHQTFFATG